MRALARSRALSHPGSLRSHAHFCPAAPSASPLDACRAQSHSPHQAQLSPPHPSRNAAPLPLSPNPLTHTATASVEIRQATRSAPASARHDTEVKNVPSDQPVPSSTPPTPLPYEDGPFAPPPAPPAPRCSSGGPSKLYRLWCNHQHISYRALPLNPSPLPDSEDLSQSST